MKHTDDTHDLKSYSELIRLESFEERERYLNLTKTNYVTARHIMGNFYKSKEWRDVRDYVIVRDNNCDLGIEGLNITTKTIVHHINPITIHMYETFSPMLLDPENLITASHNTHNKIHYGSKEEIFVERTQGDTDLW